MSDATGHVSSRCWMGRHGDSCRVCYDECSCDCHAPGDADAHYVDWLIAGCPVGEFDARPYDEPFFTVSRVADERPQPTADEIMRATREAMAKHDAEIFARELEKIPRRSAPEITFVPPPPGTFEAFEEITRIHWRLARALQIPRAMLYPKLHDPDEDGYRYRRAILLRQWRRKARTWFTLRSYLR